MFFRMLWLCLVSCILAGQSMEWNGRQIFHSPSWQFSSVSFPFHTKNLPFHIPFHIKFSSIFHSILPYQSKFRPEATRSLYCTYATLSVPLQVVACKGKQRGMVRYISSLIWITIAMSYHKNSLSMKILTTQSIGNRLMGMQLSTNFNDCKFVITKTMKFGAAKLPKTF